ncbi:MAG: 1,4-alpha-glucan branching enzyme [Elusimicrobia bacterium]|nr:1,4-alpha-glucan branching enzyme [Elusimicrobiota bacterium]
MIGSQGYLAMVLHAHLPFVRHPEYPDFLEEDWFYEAVVETYVPLLSRFERLRSEQIPFKLTMTVTPPLATMMDDGLLRSRLAHYIDQRLILLEKEIRNNRGSHVEVLARHYFSEFSIAKDFVFHRHGGHLLNSLRSLQDSGHLEIVTCTATHGFVPLMKSSSAIQSQIYTAVGSYEHFFGRKPRGIWLAECGYDDRVDAVLGDAGIEYLFLDSHGILLGDPQPSYGVYAPVITEAGINAFARDPESSKQVWSQKEGYPGDFVYREFYRDLGYDADFDYIKSTLHSDQIRRGIGVKYHAITGADIDLGAKQFYDPAKAKEKAAEHAGNFMFNRQQQVKYLRGQTQNPPIIVSPYDAELFGHWWYEGPQFLEFLIRKMAFDQSDVELIACSDYLDRHPIRQIQKPNPSTWGSEGHNLVWLNGGNAWIYRHQHWAEEKMESLSTRFADAQGDLRRALNQLLRELLLLQSSDWAFIMTTGTTVSYANKRFREHLDRFRMIASQIESNSLDMKFISFCEERDCIFPKADFTSAIPRFYPQSVYA